MNSSKFRLTTEMIITLGMLTAIEVILSRFLSIQAWNLKIGFAFIPVVVAAMCYGPLAAGIVGALADFIGAIAFPIGTYFPGFTITAFLIGIIFGIFLNKNRSMKSVVMAVIINQILCSMIINSYWIHILYGSPYIETMVSRILQCVVLTIVQSVVTYKLGTSVVPVLERMLNKKALVRS